MSLEGAERPGQSSYTAAEAGGGGGGSDREVAVGGVVGRCSSEGG